MKRGDVVRVHLPAPQGKPGHEQIGPRPAVIVQADANQSTVVVVPMTSKLKAMAFAGSVRVEPAKENGLDVPSVAMTQQVRAIDKGRILGFFITFSGLGYPGGG